MLHFLNVFSGYDQKNILKDITLSAEASTLTGIIGPNGSGKSTLLRTATKVLDISKGEIFLMRKEIRKMSLKEMSQIVSVVSQDTLFSFPFKVLDVVLMGRIPFMGRLGFESKQDIKIATEALESVDSAALKDRFIDELSGGERQRVIIAKALAQKPRILFLDEPTTHLDIGHQIEIFSLLTKLKIESKLTIVMVLHDLNLASEYCDSLVLLEKGTIKKQGIPKEVLTYQAIEEVYKTPVIVKENPITKRPHVFLVKKVKSRP